MRRVNGFMGMVTAQRYRGAEWRCKKMTYEEIVLEKKCAKYIKALQLACILLSETYRKCPPDVEKCPDCAMCWAEHFLKQAEQIDR